MGAILGFIGGVAVGTLAAEQIRAFATWACAKIKAKLPGTK